jgi:hypothetical protein
MSDPMSVIAYGLAPGLPTLVGMGPDEIGRRLFQAGIGGVFLKHHDVIWCEALKTAGLKVYGSHTVFMDNDSLWQEIAGSRPITASGDPAPVQEWYRPLLPTSQAVRKLRLHQLAELVSKLPLDGVWLDFIRWPARWESGEPQLYHSSFDTVTLTRFQLESNIEIAGGVGDPAAAAAWILANCADTWFEWRCLQIASFVDAARIVLERHRPGATLGLFTVPWTGSAKDNLTMDRAHVRVVGQDPALLGPRVDVLSPMVYHRLCGQGADWPQWVTNELRNQVSCLVWPVIEALEEDASFTDQEFADVCESAGQAGTGGLIVFNLAGLLADPGKLTILQPPTV